MALGWLNFDLPKPDFLNFGRSAIPGNDFEVDITTPTPMTVIEFYQGLRLQKEASFAWENANPIELKDSLSFDSANKFQNKDSIAFHSSLPMFPTKYLPWTHSLSVWMTEFIRFTDGLKMTVEDSMACDSMTPFYPTKSLMWDSVQNKEKTVGMTWDSGWVIHDALSLRWDSGATNELNHSMVYHNGIIKDLQWRILWDNGIRPPHGWRVPPFIPPTANKVWGRLNFNCPKPSILNFGNTCFGSQQLLVAIMDSYQVVNGAALIRVSDSMDIPVSNLTVKLDRQSWCWTLSATLMNREGYETVPASLGLVQATINGFIWQFLPDDNNYSRAFGVWNGQLTGRSPVSLLADPYSLPRSYREDSLRTGEQLALQELPEGFTLDWQLPEWVVPEGTYQYDNLTPMESILRIVKAAGGRIYPDPITKTLHAVPKWPQKPWVWTFIPDATLPADYTVKEALSNESGVPYESILVSGGTSGGVVAVCKRTDTGGETVANAVVDTLLTHLDVATARAIQELADAYPLKRYTLELPLQDQPEGAGLILPGTTFDFADGEDDGFRGLVDSVSITATSSDIVQTLELVSP
jgi:hypothetical protein